MDDVDEVKSMRIQSRGRRKRRFTRDRRFAAGQVRESNGSDKLERCSHEGYLINGSRNGHGRGGHSRALPYSVMV